MTFTLTAEHARMLDNAAHGRDLYAGFEAESSGAACRRMVATLRRRGLLEGDALTADGRIALDHHHGFAVGDTVEWWSQAGGYQKTKRGVVAEIVPAEGRPSRSRFPTLYTGAGVGFGRPEASYVVIVGARPYWPRTRALRRAPR